MMSRPDNEKRTRLLAEAIVTAQMDPWMLVEAFDEICLFGFAQKHPNTGGLSWVLSTRVVEFTEAEDRARTASGRIYSLGRRIFPADLDEEGYVALRLLTSLDDYPGRKFDMLWVTSQKMARHLKVEAPARNDVIGVERFATRYMEAYLALHAGWSAYIRVY